jgi:hypothetical protein
MRRAIAIMSAGALLVLSAAGAWAEAPATLTTEMIENANTPAEHQAVARYYREKAAEAKDVAAKHTAMGKSTFAGKPNFRDMMKKHCERITKLNEELAAQYEELAKEQDAAAAAPKM